MLPSHFGRNFGRYDGRNNGRKAFGRTLHVASPRAGARAPTASERRRRRTGLVSPNGDGYVWRETCYVVSLWDGHGRWLSGERPRARRLPATSSELCSFLAMNKAQGAQIV